MQSLFPIKKVNIVMYLWKIYIDAVLSLRLEFSKEMDVIIVYIISGTSYI